MLLTKRAHSADLVVLNKDPDNGHKPGSDCVEQPVITERATNDAEAHELAQPVDGNHELTRLQAAD